MDLSGRVSSTPFHFYLISAPDLPGYKFVTLSFLLIKIMIYTNGLSHSNMHSFTLYFVWLQCKLLISWCLLRVSHLKIHLFLLLLLLLLLLSKFPPQKNLWWIFHHKIKIHLTKLMLWFKKIKKFTTYGLFCLWRKCRTLNIWNLALKM